MSPEELIAAVEALDKAARPGPWAVDGEDGYIRGADGMRIFITDGYFFLNSEDADLIARYRTLAPELARMLRESLARCAMVVALKNEVLRLTAESDEATKRAVEWEIQAQDFRDRAVQAEAERDELRTRLSEREEECGELERRRLMAYRAYCDVSRRLDEVDRERKEDRARAMTRLAELEAELATMRTARDLADARLERSRDERSGEFVRLDLQRQAQAARIDQLEAELAALRAAQTPRPIAEAPRDGTWVLVYWDTQPHEAPIVVQAGARGWWDGFRYVEPSPTHFLPLKVKP